MTTINNETLPQGNVIGMKPATVIMQFTNSGEAYGF